MLKSRATSASFPATATVLTAALFFLALLLVAFKAPLTFDEGFNANVALSLAQGLGYGTHAGGAFTPFNPRVSTGLLFIAPFSIPLILAGPSIAILQVYSLGLTSLFLGIALIYGFRIHRCFPLVLLLLSATYLFHGKSDLVPGSSVPSIPEPPFGLWHQFLGNMAGAWAAIAAVIIAAAAPVLTRSKHLVVLFLCAVFACNAKMMHTLPLAVALVTLLVCTPRLSWPAVLIGLCGVLVGMKLDPTVAALTMSASELKEYRAAALEFFLEYQGTYVEFFSAPSMAYLDYILKNIGAQWRGAVEYVESGLFVLLFVSAFVGVVAQLRTKATASTGVVIRLVGALVLSSLAVIVWWAGIPEAPIRFLTPIAPLVVGATAAAVVAACSLARGWGRGVVCCLAGYLVVATMVGRIEPVRSAMSIGMTVREEQVVVAGVSKQISSESPPKPLCGAEWWYPHEISFLADSPTTTWCGANFPRLVVVPKHIYPAGIGAAMLAEGCGGTSLGTFYDLAVCGG